MKRRVAACGASAAAFVVLAARPAVAQSPLCEGLPGPAALACEATTISVTGAVGGAVGGLADSAVSGLASAFADAAIHFLRALGSALSATTSVDVSSAWFVERYAVMFGLSAFLTFALLILSILKSVLRGQGTEAIRSATLYYLAAVTASAFAPAAVYLLLQLSDQLSSLLAAGAQEDVERFLTGAGTALGSAMTMQAGVGPAALLVAAVATVFCAGILWMELLLRTAVIYVSLLFAAPTFAGLVDRGLWKHSRRWVYFTISVIFAKPVVVAVLTLAAAGAGAGGPQDGFTSIFVALALLIVAIFCVGLLFRLVPNAGDEIAGALSARRELTNATPHSPLPGPGVVVRQSVQSHLVRGLSKPAAAAAPPVAAAAAAGVAAHRVTTAAARTSTSAVRSSAPGGAA